MFRLLRAIIRHKLQELLSFSFVLQFLSYCIGDPFCITNQNYCLYGVRCPLLFVFGFGGFALVNLPVVLVYGYGRARVTWIFVGMLVSRIGVGSGGWASVPLWYILLPARVVGFTQLSSS